LWGRVIDPVDPRINFVERLKQIDIIYDRPSKSVQNHCFVDIAEIVVIGSGTRNNGLKVDFFRISVIGLV